MNEVNCLSVFCEMDEYKNYFIAFRVIEVWLMRYVRARVNDVVFLYSEVVVVVFEVKKCEEKFVCFVDVK